MTWTDLHKMKLEIIMRTHSEKATWVVDELFGSAAGSTGEHEATDILYRRTNSSKCAKAITYLY